MKVLCLVLANMDHLFRGYKQNEGVSPMSIDINLMLTIAAGILMASVIKKVVLVGVAFVQGGSKGGSRYSQTLNSSASSRIIR